MDPFSMAAASGGLQIAGGVLGAKGALDKGAADASMYKYRAAVARVNKQVAEQNSDYALASGDKNAYRKGLETSFTLGKQTVAQGANGFDVNSGTNVDVRDSTQAMGYMDQATIREEASRKAYGYRVKAASEEASAQMDEQAAVNAKKAAKIQAISTILGTAGSVASKWTQGAQSFGGASKGITTYNENMQPVGWFA